MLCTSICVAAVSSEVRQVWQLVTAPARQAEGGAHLVPAAQQLHTAGRGQWCRVRRVQQTVGQLSASSHCNVSQNPHCGKGMLTASFKVLIYIVNCVIVNKYYWTILHT